jgi:hypothetical protein
MNEVVFNYGDRNIPKSVDHLVEKYPLPVADELLSAPRHAAEMIYAMNDAGQGFEGSVEERDLIATLCLLDKQLQQIKRAVSELLPESAKCPSASGVHPRIADLVQTLADMYSNLKGSTGPVLVNGGWEKVGTIKPGDRLKPYSDKAQQEGRKVEFRIAIGGMYEVWMSPATITDPS